ncbi:hypothetical protein C2845_PM01G22780 [Panicum miliaceum]|uniref:Uncharacterized protein n=1 Tax=Panicum miliaceum TaxID=4540 RepID=A0A3L6TRW7_PANMI|nr:hypothetical protein C2845_PM01G22780 [Panicum miliaceum]
MSASRAPVGTPAGGERYVKYHHIYGGEEESRKSNYTDLVNKYYDLATSFYDSFHFAGRWQEETFHESIKRHQHFIALQLGLKKVLDVGCGIGGPLIEIARFSFAPETFILFQSSLFFSADQHTGVPSCCTSRQYESLSLPADCL